MRGKPNRKLQPISLKLKQLGTTVSGDAQSCFRGLVASVYQRIVNSAVESECEPLAFWYFRSYSSNGGTRILAFFA